MPGGAPQQRVLTVAERWWSRCDCGFVAEGDGEAQSLAIARGHALEAHALAPSDEALIASARYERGDEEEGGCDAGS